MRAGKGLSGLLLLAASTVAGPAAANREPAGLHQALQTLAREGRLSGAVVVRGPEGVRFARGYGWADPFERRAFTPDTPVDSASLAKPVTSAAVLLLVRDGKIELDAPVQRYLPEYPHSSGTVRHLLSHSAGLDFKDSPEGLANKSNAALLAASAAPLFPSGAAFTYCNLCSITLALLIERVAGMHYLDFVKGRLAVRSGVSLRPPRLKDWSGRAIGYRRKADGQIERFDSWEGELLYGAANFSISAAQLADWGSEWWKSRLLPIRRAAMTPARIGRNVSGLTLGNWYCAHRGRRCHYLGHHEGFHHMLYWDADRRVSVAMVTNNALAPAFHQRLQRALVAFARNRPVAAQQELKALLPSVEAPVGDFRIGRGELVAVKKSGSRVWVVRRGLIYPAYPTSPTIRYVPGLDAYIAGDERGRLHWISLYEDFVSLPLELR
ncbi:MAG: beta-lactamase family protein [Sphingomonas sp.]|nr:beta-lactamase family protein [Sphingomonas sp.]